jgi:hypothetical protein
MTMTPSDVPAPRRRRRIACGCAALGAAALLIAGCGSAAAPSSGSDGTHGTASGGANAGTTAAAKISLTVSFSGSASTTPQHYALRCEPAGGTVHDAAAACAMLMRHAAGLFGKLPARMECPMIMADGGRATVTGTYLGRHVHELVVDGGCDLSRWAELGQIVRAGS